MTDSEVRAVARAVKDILRRKERRVCAPGRWLVRREGNTVVVEDLT